MRRSVVVSTLGITQTLAGSDVFPSAVGGVEPQAGGGAPSGCRVQGRRGPGGSARAEPSLPFSVRLIFAAASSSGVIPVAAASLGVGEPGERIDGGAGIRVRIEADAALCADATPVAGEERAAEQVGPDGHTVVAPLVEFRPDAGQCGLIGEQGKLKRLGHWCHDGRDLPTSVSADGRFVASRRREYRVAVWCRVGGLIHYCL